MKKANADLNLSIDCECPYCEHIFDLLDDNQMTDDGMIYKEAMNDKKGWGCLNFNKEIDCPKCGKKFIVESINY